MIQFDDDHATVQGWDRLNFHFFPTREMHRYSSGKWQALRIRDDEPGMAEVTGAIVSALGKAATHRSRASIGVYNSDGCPVEGSVQFRGSVGRTDKPHDQPVPGDAIRDPRHAYYLGIDASRYGHFILETLCRAWAWEQNKCQVVIIQAPPIPAFARAILELIPDMAQRVETLQHATRFDNLIVPDPTFVMGREAYMRFKLLCEQIADRAVRKGETTTDQPLYLSRAGLAHPAKRLLVGEARLERFLVAEGFRVVRPETLSIPAQIALFNRHKWILTPNGSACHTRLFSQIAANMIVMTSEKVKGSFILNDLLCQGDTHYANLLSRPDFGDNIPVDAAQPVMLEEERFLTLLRKFGLVRSEGAFAEPAPDREAYNGEWVQFASKRRRNRFRSAIDRLSDPGPTDL